MRASKNGSTSALRIRGIGTALVVAVFGLLLWAKLLLVTNHPRTAVADPPVAPAPAAAADRATAAVPAEAP